MYDLYYSPGAASMAVHLTLREIGAPFTLKRVDMSKGEHKQAAYLKLNPAGLIPTLMVDGAPQTETPACLQILTERHPEAGLAPQPGQADRGQYLRWLAFISNTIHPAMMGFFYPDRLTKGGDADAIKAAAHDRLVGIWDMIEAHLAQNGPYLLGQRLTAADLFLVVTARWARSMAERKPTDRPHVRALCDLVTKRPSWQAVIAEEKPAEWVY